MASSDSEQSKSSWRGKPPLWVRNPVKHLRQRYLEKHKADIAAGRMPDKFRSHIANRVYDHRFGWSLVLPGTFLALALFSVKPSLDFLGINPISTAYGTMALAILALPLLAYIWFLRSYERDRELTREEHGLWSNEFTQLMKAAADTNPENVMLRRAAVRQFQDYLTGAKWGTNRRSNSTAILELFSSIVDEFRQQLTEFKRKQSDEKKIKEEVTQIKNNPILITIGAVVRASFPKGSPPQVSQDNLSGLHFDFLNLSDVDLSGLNLKASTMEYTYLVEADLSNANLLGAKLEGADLLMANLKEVLLTFADLSYANLQQADLGGADIAMFDLAGADVACANLKGANLSSAILKGTGITLTMLKAHDWGVEFNESTQWGDKLDKC